MTQEQGLVDPKDHQAISDLLARYCWAFDDGDAEAYAALWVEDGVLSGFGDPVKGIEGLKEVVTGTLAQSEGKWRHLLGNLIIRYAGGRDQIVTKGYNQVSRWQNEPALQMMVLATFTAVRREGEWKLSAVDLKFV